LSGFWHGANWTFVLWGAYHALLFVPLLLMGKNRRYRDTVATVTLPDGTIKTKWLPSLKETGQMLFTFALAVFGWIIFRATNIGQFGEVVSTIFSKTILSIPWLINRGFYIPLFLSIGLMLMIEWVNRGYSHSLVRLTPYRWINWLIYYAIIFIMYKYQPLEDVQFIYFQF
jgi:D-alanyl-lipoteichoic acid acyltransferase DltB (MBOAT superfamily)